MIQIALLEPEIPQNTGNIARTCACLGAVLHITEPMGFVLTERNLKRAGCDYWNEVEIKHWPSTDKFLEATEGMKLHLFTGSATKFYTDVTYSDEDILVFGRESAGISPEILTARQDDCVRIPMREDLRSLNLSNAVAIAAYEASRQLGFNGLV